MAINSENVIHIYSLRLTNYVIDGKPTQTATISQFVNWNRNKGLRYCFTERE